MAAKIKNMVEKQSLNNFDVIHTLSKAPGEVDVDFKTPFSVVSSAAVKTFDGTSVNIVADNVQAAVRQIASKPTIGESAYYQQEAPQVLYVGPGRDFETIGAGLKYYSTLVSKNPDNPRPKAGFSEAAYFTLVVTSAYQPSTNEIVSLGVGIDLSHVRIVSEQDSLIKADFRVGNHCKSPIICCRVFSIGASSQSTVTLMLNPTNPTWEVGASDISVFGGSTLELLDSEDVVGDHNPAIAAGFRTTDITAIGLCKVCQFSKEGSSLGVTGNILLEEGSSVDINKINGTLTINGASSAVIREGGSQVTLDCSETSNVTFGASLTNPTETVIDSMTVSMASQVYVKNPTAGTPGDIICKDASDLVLDHKEASLVSGLNGIFTNLFCYDASKVTLKDMEGTGVGTNTTLRGAAQVFISAGSSNVNTNIAVGAFLADGVVFKEV